MEQKVVPYVPKLDDKAHWSTEYIQQNFDAVVIAIKQTGLDLDVIKDADVIVESFVQID